MTALRIAVLGPGGVGGMLGALLARDGHAVTCLARPETAEHVQRHGLTLSSDRFGAFTAPARGTTRLDAPVDVCLVTPKATQLAAALDRLPAEVLGTAVLVPLLNGIDHLELLRARYPEARTVAGAIQVAAHRPAPGTVRHDGSLAAVTLAPGAEQLADALAATGVDVDVRPDERGLLWAKLCLLAPLALLTTSLAAPLGTAREQRAEDLRAVVEEVAAVSRADGADPDPTATLELLHSLPAGMRSSMQRDAEAGRPTELDAIGGAVLRAAGRHGIDVPATRRIVEELRARL
ncbi:ketopantoate reductase family protein [Blastococcus tunisiensis]|uniref:2-dehydropantoate 2-reductase n=1 Tax=Blastococcus tunisiensis TaxID=1798228 RepID=A0A1I2KIJ8_9ACTN|nr:2-dehydropantoate 2-reductase [Blastococcus sp. DSM 46838]SFF64921.1 2-dehydropantoate 2-reductase [Blastococcus sp. DSM 46838]